MSQANTNNRQLPFLLEIGSEEIPARFIPTAMAEITARLGAALAEARLEAVNLRALATPRRMCVLADGLDVRQPDREVEMKGPPVSVAFDGDGNPTPAGLGFAKKVGVDLAECGRGEDQRGAYLLVQRREEGRPAAEVLGEILPRLILEVPFRKVMRWGDYDLEYPRPLQWLVALLGTDVVDVAVGHLRSGRVSRGHRTLAGNAAVEITDAASYVETLRASGVIVDQDEREQLIREGFARELAAWNPAARLHEDEELLTEVVHLCEHPRPFLGAYEDEYSALPDQVITTALKAHQRYFSVCDAASGRLLNRFAAVRDGGEDHLDNVVAGNERVLRARLADALFYWTFDQKKSPDERVAMLGSVTWLEGFGTMLDKTRRLEGLAPRLWRDGLGEGEAPADLARAAAICKSDLVSEMIKDGKEFTKLEGFIGARYAELAGENAAVCAAIETHYLPRTATGDLPGDAVSAALSAADRLDTVAGCWLAGFVPTGAKDPYALRRHVLAVIRILLDRGAQVDLDQALDAAWEQVLPYAKEGDAAAQRAELATFVKTRLEGYCTDVLGCPLEVVRAVLPVRGHVPVAAVRWIRALEGFRDREDFQQLATGFKRCRNILKGATLPTDALDACRDRWLAGGSGAAGEDFAILAESAEVALKEAVAAAAPTLRDAEMSGNHDEVFAILSSLGPAIDAFFDAVMVNVEDEALRAVRHGFLREIHGLFVRYADFAEVAAGD
jgi:glycyl-tRNA synthetase beta chain